MPVLIDSHCHLDRLTLDKYQGCLTSAINAAHAVGVEKFLCVGINLDTVDQVIELADKYPSVFASVGVHPLETKPKPLDPEALLKYTAHPRVIAIGETGLDYHYAKEDKISQQEYFTIHLQVAAQAGLPVIIHTREAQDDTLTIIRNHANLESSGVFHCFTESWEMAQAALSMNFMISISGIVTFGNASALRDVVKKVPIDRLLIETDSPYLAPVPHRGKANEPAFLADVANYVADIKNISIAELAEQTTDNFYQLFKKAIK